MRHDGLALLNYGNLALSEISMNGIYVDIEQIDKSIQEVEAVIDNLKAKLETNEHYIKWKDLKGSDFNFNSDDQLRWFLFDVLKQQPTNYTAKNQAKVDKTSLEYYDYDFLKIRTDIKKFEKAKSTYLINLKDLQYNNFLHPNFMLTSVTTYRSSTNNPNIQNFPIRDPEIGTLIRSCVKSRFGEKGLIAEFDFSGIEVRIGACYHKDANMISYIKDKERDMHRDTAMQCYMLEQDEVSKNIRYCGKNKFVFPQFYGDYWLNCAEALYKAVSDMKLETKQGKPLEQHLREKFKTNDFKEPFFNHIKKVEKVFWNKMFYQYRNWKEDWYADYICKGYFYSYTGFKYTAPMKFNEAVNYPIQGSAFHCLLWCLIQIHNLTKKHKLKSKIIGQIHDSLLFDIHEDEINTIYDMCISIMNDKLCKNYKWICVPIEAECEMSPLGKSWSDKKEYKN